MQISRRSADRYRKALDAIGKEAVREFEQALDWYRSRNPDASVAEYRDFAIYIAEQTVREYGGASSKLSADLFDLIMESEGFSGIEAETIDPLNHERIEGAVRRHAGQLAKETPDYPAFKKGCSGLVRNESRAAANDTTAHNVEKANGKRGRGSGKVRYAVVPTKALPCAYCAMLASRGFVYRSQETAETSTHRDCTCAFLPGIEGVTTVEGYDHDHYVDVWQNHWKYEEMEMMRAEPEEESNRVPINEHLYNSQINYVLRHGGTVLRGGEEVNRHLDSIGADAAELDGILFFRDDPTTSEVLEEVFHFDQTRRRDYYDPENAELMTLRREIDAQNYLLSVTERYSIPEQEVQHTRRMLAGYLSDLERYFEEYREEETNES